jgi:predicted Zn-dependent protease
MLAHFVAALALLQAFDPAAESEKARQLVAGGHPDEALPIYNRLLRSYPSNAELLLNLSIAEFSAARYSGSAEHAVTALKLKPELAPANLFAGASYLKLGEYSIAVDWLRKAVAASPGDRSANLMLAEALLGSKHSEEALAEFQRLLTAFPDNPRVWCGLGEAYDALAELASRQLQGSFPDSSYWLVLAGNSYLKQRRFGSAFTAYQDALSRGPVIPGIHAGLAQVYRETGHPQWAAQEAISETKIKSAENSSEGPASIYAAYLAHRANAAQAYDRLDRLPPSLESRLHRAKTLDEGGLHREAAIEWREALHFAPRDKSIQIGLAQALYDSRDYEQVLSTLADTLKEDPNSGPANFLYGASLLNLGQSESAIPYLQKASHHHDQFRATNAALGQAWLNLAKSEQAIPFLKLAITDDPEGTVHFQLFRAYQLIGNRELASKAYSDYEQHRRSLDEQKKFEDGLQITAPTR